MPCISCNNLNGSFRYEVDTFFYPTSLESMTARNRKAYLLSADTVSVTWEPPAKQFKLFKYRVYLKWKSRGRWYCKKVCYNAKLPNCTASLKNIPSPQNIFILSWITKDITPLPVTCKLGLILVRSQPNECFRDFVNGI